MLMSMHKMKLHDKRKQWLKKRENCKTGAHPDWNGDATSKHLQAFVNSFTKKNLWKKKKMKKWKFYCLIKVGKVVASAKREQNDTQHRQRRSHHSTFNEHNG